MLEDQKWKCLYTIEQINNEIYDDAFQIKEWYDYPLYVVRMVLCSFLLGFLILLKLLISAYQITLAILYIFYSFIKKIVIRDKKIPRSRSQILEESFNDKPVSLILDLDNTIIYTTYKKIEQIKDYTIMDKLYVYKRPYLDRLLNEVSKYCDITIYTSASMEYANQIIDYIDKNRVIGKRLFREDCYKINDTYYKDFWKHGFDSKKVIIVDDSPEVHINSKENLIPIKKWYGSQYDDSLLKISKTLSNLRYTEDVRGMIRTLININEAQ